MEWQMKKYVVAIVMLLITAYVSADENSDDALRIAIKDSAGSYSFCKKMESYCTEEVDINKYLGQEGVLTSLTPVKHGVFEIKMSDGELIYYLSSADNPLNSDYIIKLSDYKIIKNQTNQ
jgi:hypothetical protein